LLFAATDLLMPAVLGRRFDAQGQSQPLDEKRRLLINRHRQRTHHRNRRRVDDVVVRIRRVADVLFATARCTALKVT